MGDGIAWFARNPVAANLMMVFIIMSGAIATQAVKEEVYPEICLGADVPLQFCFAAFSRIGVFHSKRGHESLDGRRSRRAGSTR